MLPTIVAEELRSMLAPSFDAGGFVAGPDSMEELRTEKMRFNMCAQALKSVENHRAELLTENKDLKAMNRELSKKAKTLDAMLDLLRPVHQG